MNDDEPVIKLIAGEDQEESGSPVRLSPDRSHGHSLDAKDTGPELRVLEESEVKPTIPDIPTLEQEPRRPSFAGKSIDYTIDEIIQPETAYDPDAIEQEWGEKKKQLPKGWIVLLILFLGFIGYGMTRMLEKNRIAEKRITEQPSGLQEMEKENAHDLVQSIERTVRNYYAANTIEEKIQYVRHAEQMRPRMEMHYATHPLEAEQCELVTNFQLLTIGGKTFWKVLAIKHQKKAELILLEQISDTEVLVDWDSHVDFEFMPWDQYLREPPSSSICYRLSVKGTHRYVAEFMNESQWVCYRLTKPSSDRILFGYVRRNSSLHREIHNALSSGSNRMILKIQYSTMMRAKDSVVIQELISDSIFRTDPPKSLKD